MTGIRAAVCLLGSLAAICLTTPAFPEVSEPTGSRARIPLGSPPGNPVPVPRWNATSPQTLVRIGDVLYQEGEDFYYRVVADTITVRLNDDVEDWNELVRRAKVIDPATYALLDQLEAGPKNRLDTIDLTLSGGDPAEWCELVHGTGLVRFAEVATYGVYLATPNDPQYTSQWALNNSGQTGGTPGADIGAEAAWDITAGTPSTIVAVLDSGTAIDHEDLAPNVWHNDAEIPGNGQDDDGNGFVDDWEGWDFGNGNNDPRSGAFHGTHVTGIVNAATNNGIGIAGVAGGFGGPGVSGMALAVGDSAPNGAVLDNAILYAADMGAHVITMSLTVGVSSAVNNALAYAYNTQDVFIDCASGNNGSSVGYPANRGEVMAVASTTANDVQSSFSNPGPEVEVAAPGSGILSTQLNNSYGSSSGTSFAAPQVAGVAGLIRSANPGLTAPDVRQLIIDTADDVGPAGFDNGTGHGRVNAAEALAAAASSDGRVELDATRYSCSDLLTVTVTDVDLSGSSSVDVLVRSTLEPSGETLTLTATGPASSAFQGGLPTDGGAALSDGALQVLHDDDVTVEYLDADDGEGGMAVLKTASASTDCLGPSLSSVVATVPDNTSAVISWTSDEPATSLVRYDELTPPAQEASTGGTTTGHSVQLNGLADCTVYRFEVESADDLDNTSTDDNGGSFFVFETLGDIPGVGIVPCHQGQATLDRAEYTCLDTAQVSVTDADLGDDPGAVETIQVLLTSSTETGGEWITLTEDSPQSSHFTGSIDLEDVAAVPDGKLAIGQGDVVSVTYYDADDGEGKPRLDVVSASVDCAAPDVGDVQVTAVSATRAVISWTSDEPGTSRVEFGPTAGLGSVAEDTSLTTSHAVAISAFEACDRVHFQVSSTDAHGYTRMVDSGGQPFQLNLKQVGGLVFHDNFETDTGWILPGEWERGVPAGLGSSAGDPLAAYSGGTVLGNDLSGAGSFPGDYEPLAREIAVSPVLDASGLPNLELIVERRLGVTGSDEAEITVFQGGTHTVWSSGGSVNDTDWIEARYNISSAAGGASAFRIRFDLESTDPGQSFGWNLDELIVKDATQPDYLACGGCGGEPTFAGVRAVFDPDPCGVSGLTLEWEPAPAWGTGASGTYDVHRGTTPDFVPLGSNRIAFGVTGTSWTDTTAPVDTPVWYLVRARNDETCAGGEGLAETNAVRLGVTDTLSQPSAGSVEDSVRVLAVGDAHARLTWQAAPAAEHYVVRRGTSFDFTAPVEVGTTTTTVFEDLEAALDAASYAYRVFAVNSCGQETP